MTLVKPEIKYRLLAAFVFFEAVLVVTTYFHESWRDEAQAWLLARDLSPLQLWFMYLRYEGTPGLWHTLLLTPAHLGLPYWSMHVLSCLFASGAAALVCWRSPFPQIVKIVLPFTYFFIYQYAVVARSYTMFPFVIFLTALLIPQARRRTYLFLFLLIVMANISLHGTLAAAGILAAYLADLWSGRNHISQAEIRRHVIAGGIFVLTLIFLVIQLWPPADLTSVPLSAQELRPKWTIVSTAIEQTADALSACPPIIAHAGGSSLVGPARDSGVAAVLDLAFFCLGLLASCLVLMLTLEWFYKTGTILYFVLPAGSVLLLSSLILGKRWHSGIIFFIWLFAIWITANRTHQPAPRSMWLVWILVLAPHLFWSAKTIAYDINKPYSGSKAAAQYLKTSGLKDRVIFAAGIESTSIQPYFTKNLFKNYHDGEKPAFWLWSTSNDFPQFISSIPLSRPDVLLLSLRTEEQRSAIEQLVQTLPQSGYVLAGKFDGNPYWKSFILEPESFLIICKRELKPIIAEPK